MLGLTSQIEKAVSVNVLEEVHRRIRPVQRKLSNRFDAPTCSGQTIDRSVGDVMLARVTEVRRALSANEIQMFRSRR